MEKLQAFGEINGNRISLLRLDLPDPLSGGNKSFKLKYNLEALRQSGKEQLLTFGGAFSNHIAAAAAAGKTNGIKTVGIIRGEELSAGANAVLRFALSCGMELHFVSRETYRRRHDADFLDALQQEFPAAYLLPEGGSNAHAVKGCMEILPGNEADVIFCPVGSGATLAGIIASAKANQQVIGITVLEGKKYLAAEVKRLLVDRPVNCEWEINGDFIFGGYAKTDSLLQEFISRMKEQHALPLDHVYSGKTFYALHEMAKGDAFRGKHLLFVHTGGYAFENAAR